jgi:hypothetical protein
MRAITAFVRGSRRVSIADGASATQTEPKAVSTEPGVAMGIDLTAPGADVALGVSAPGADVVLGVTAPGADVALDVAMGRPAGSGAAAWQATRVSKQGAVAPIPTQNFTVLLTITSSFARADRSRRTGSSLWPRPAVELAEVTEPRTPWPGSE